MSAELYLRHYALQSAPFEMTAEARFFFEGAGRGDMLRALRHALAHEQGVVLVTGEIGTGKSALCRMVLADPPPQLDCAYLPHPTLTRAELIGALARDLGVTDLSPTPLEALQRALIERHAGGRRVVVLVDEAHAMPRETLEEVRLLTNLESGAGKLLTVALFAQPEILALLAQPVLRPLRDRVVQHFKLAPLRPDEVADYVEFRLRAAGYRGSRLFEQAAIRTLARCADGRSRRVNVLADRALLTTFTRGGRIVTRRDVRRSARELALVAGSPAERWWRRIRSALPRLQEA